MTIRAGIFSDPVITGQLAMTVGGHVLETDTLITMAGVAYHRGGVGPSDLGFWRTPQGIAMAIDIGAFSG